MKYKIHPCPSVFNSSSIMSMVTVSGGDHLSKLSDHLKHHQTRIVQVRLLIGKANEEPDYHHPASPHSLEPNPSLSMSKCAWVTIFVHVCNVHCTVDQNTFVQVCKGDHSPKPSLNCSPANRPHQLVPSKGQMLKPRRKKSPKLLKLEESNTNDLCQETPQSLSLLSTLIM